MISYKHSYISIFYISFQFYFHITNVFSANSANCLGLNCGTGSCYINGEGFAKCTCPSCSFSDNCEHKGI